MTKEEATIAHAKAFLEGSGYIVVKEEDVDLLTVQVAVADDMLNLPNIDIKAEEKRAVVYKFGQHLDGHGFIKWSEEHQKEYGGRTIISAKVKVFK